MPALGTLEVLLVNAHGLHNADFLCNMDPYVILKCRTQEHKSKVAYREGINPVWNEKFVFNLSEGTSDLIIRLMDKDKFSADDFIGEATIPLEGVLMEGSIPPSPYNVVLPDKTYCGQIKVGLTFIPKVTNLLSCIKTCVARRIYSGKRGRRLEPRISIIKKSPS